MKDTLFLDICRNDYRRDHCSGPIKLKSTIVLSFHLFSITNYLSVIAVL